VGFARVVSVNQTEARAILFKKKIMKNGLNKVTQFDVVKFPAVQSCGSTRSLKQRSKRNNNQHPYMKAGFHFKCCNVVNHEHH
jgi:hypothetical protein